MCEGLCLFSLAYALQQLGVQQAVARPNRPHKSQANMRPLIARPPHGLGCRKTKLWVRA